MRRANDLSLGDALKLFVKQFKHHDELNRIRIEKAWEALMGKGIVAQTGKIQFNKGVLNLYITSAPLKHELLMSREKIAARLNEKLGEVVIKEVKIR